MALKHSNFITVTTFVFFLFGNIEPETPTFFRKQLNTQ